MKHHSRRVSRVVLACSAALVLAACGGGDDKEATGTLKLGITDAPVDAADAVVVQFSGVELKPKGGEPFSVDFVDSIDQPLPKEVDLYLLTGTKRDLLLEGEEIPAGQYEWMRLKVDADPNVVDSYIEIGGAQCELRVPSGDETGLKINRAFTVGVGAITDLTIDFDLRKSIVAPPGQESEPAVCDGQAYLLKPVLRVVDTLEVGTISGKVDPLPLGCESSGAAYPGNVYLFGPYTDVAPAVDDYDGVDDPVTWATVDPATFEYTIGFVPAGKYVIAYTCSPDSTTVDADTDVSEEVTFVPEAGALIELAPGANVIVDFPPLP